MPGAGEGWVSGEVTRLDTAGVARLLGRRCGSWEQFQAGQCCDQPTATMGEWLEPR